MKYDIPPLTKTSRGSSPQEGAELAAVITRSAALGNVSKYSVIVATALALLPIPASSQVEDPQMRRAWQSLQHLSARAGTIWNCYVSGQVDGAVRQLRNDRPSAIALSRHYRDARAELAREIESYVDNYVARHPSENKHSYTYSVWQIMLEVGKENAREATNESCAKFME